MLSHLTIWGSQGEHKTMNCPQIVTIVDQYYNEIYNIFSGEPDVLKHSSEWVQPTLGSITPHMQNSVLLVPLCLCPKKLGRNLMQYWNMGQK